MSKAFIVSYRTGGGRLVTTALNAPSAESATRRFRVSQNQQPESVDEVERIRPDETTAEILARHPWPIGYVLCSNCASQFYVKGQIHGYSHCDQHEELTALTDEEEVW